MRTERSRRYAASEFREHAKNMLAELRNEQITAEERTLLKIVSAAVAVAALATIPVTIVELNGSHSLPIRVADWIIWFVFAVEWSLMLLFPPNTGGFRGRSAFDRRNWRDWRNWLSVTILIISFPLLYPAFQLIRLMRVVRFARIGRVTVVTTRALGDTVGRRGVIYVGALVSFAVVLGGVLMSSLEASAVGGTGIWDGIWWAAATTVGTGIDGPGPQTAEGRAITMILMLCGVAFVTTLAGSIAAYFLGQHSGGGMAEMDRRISEIHDSVTGSPPQEVKHSEAGHTGEISESSGAPED